MKAYLELARPKTLPLALSVILLGNALAWWQGQARLSIFLLEMLTAFSLQILSNIANDYGDGVRGTDTHRQGPRRMLASGMISARVLRGLIGFFAAFSLMSGILVIVVAHRSLAESLTLFAFGVLAIIAAITYTVGRHAYGYYALGEVSVVLFFGGLGVCGSFYLQTAPLPASVWLVAAGAGILAASVLHINNLRDIDSDAASGRQTLAIYLGFARARLFHLGLLGAGMLCYLCFALLNYRSASYSLLFLLALPWVMGHAQRIRQAESPAIAGRELKSIVLLNLALAALFAGGLCLGRLLA